MSCWNGRRYYVLSDDEQLFLGYTKGGIRGMIANLPWSKPYLFSSVTRARKAAIEHHGKVCYWPGRVRPNAVTDNAE